MFQVKRAYRQRISCWKVGKHSFESLTHEPVSCSWYIRMLGRSTVKQTSTCAAIFLCPSICPPLKLFHVEPPRPVAQATHFAKYVGIHIRNVSPTNMFDVKFSANSTRNPFHVERLPIPNQRTTGSPMRPRRRCGTEMMRLKGLVSREATALLATLEFRKKHNSSFHVEQNHVYNFNIIRN